MNHIVINSKHQNATHARENFLVLQQLCAIGIYLVLYGKEKKLLIITYAIYASVLQ